MRYTGPAGMDINVDELKLIHRALMHDNTPEAYALRQRVRAHLNDLDLRRHLEQGGTVGTWTPPLHKVIE